VRLTVRQGTQAFAGACGRFETLELQERQVFSCFWIETPPIDTLENRNSQTVIRRNHLFWPPRCTKNTLLAGDYPDFDQQLRKQGPGIVTDRRHHRHIITRISTPYH